MKYFVWIVKAAHESLLEGEAGISTAYTPPYPGEELSRALIGSVVFVVVRGKDVDVLLKKIFVYGAAKLQDGEGGVSNNQLEIYVDLLRSVGIAENFRSGIAAFAILSTRNFEAGLHLISRKVAMSFQNVIEKHFIQKFLKFPQEWLLDVEKRENSPYLEAERLIREIVRAVPLTRIWGNARSRRNPFLNFAVACAEKAGVSEEVRSALPILCENLFRIEFVRNSGVLAVDTELAHLDPKKIRARKFISSGEERNLFAEAEKTSAAELRHQKILADLCSILLAHRLEPLQSRSIDLAIRFKRTVIVFEIKTSDSGNVFSQVAKGVFQLATYSHRLNVEGENVVRKILVLEENFSQETRDFLVAVIRGLGIEVLFYDVRRNWPNRLSPPLRLE